MPAIPQNWRAPLYRFYEERLRGRRTFEHLDLLLDTQWWPRAALLEYQWTELHRLLTHAYQQVPFHRRRMLESGLRPEAIRTPDDYARLPLMIRRDFAQHRAELLAGSADRARLHENGSGGSTGEPVRYLADRD